MKQKVHDFIMKYIFFGWLEDASFEERIHHFFLALFLVLAVLFSFYYFC